MIKLYPKEIEDGKVRANPLVCEHSLANVLHVHDFDRFTVLECPSCGSLQISEKDVTNNQ